ncbi:hypothetical protein D2E64_13570 [Mycobacteroides abscessus]|uniref:hypothetical protein n=1 Tax=Mycobacteroides abscessus TaxID=36809 RepID=UPI000C259F06|nr:hypothetical protein [Mycobacteroides abscessus]PVA22809.1 hypothetical protein DDJ61_04025 [Mycobacteroides abscessus]PVA83880.1 hypothetical protein DDJ76_13960 [Mycobacteroides abscessus]RIR96142.1 hypothetical protein D2E50_00530 [Mycobacteroides abscessus]RIS07960.1 hypothetical protein D2E63_15330 [Mycobacteroides abscessus]RIS15960.1 hypothetical protein D2E69_17090 [Mycobacteroides abscessus]
MLDNYPEEDAHGNAVVVSQMDVRTQAVAIVSASALLLIFVLAVSFWFQSNFKVPRIFYTIDILSIVVGIFILTAPTIAADLSKLLGANAGSKRTVELRSLKTFCGSPRVISTYIWTASIVQFLLFGFLAMQTGGIDKSPFTAVLTTIFALSPYVMNGVGSVWLVWTSGVAYFIVLTSVRPFIRDFISEPSSYLYMIVNIVTISFAIIIAGTIKWLQNRPESID